MQKIKVNLGFISASLAFLVIFAASATPIPLYDIYRKADGLNYNDLALTAVVYFIGAITALLIFGRISNHLGRKPVIFLCFALAAVSSIILLDVSSATPLILGRLLLGLACGLASSAVASYIVDKGSSLPNWVPAAVVSNSPMVGLTIGAVVSGSLVEYAPYPRELCYFVVLAALAICTVLITFSKESVEQKPGVISSLKPKFSLPHEDKRLYPIAACTFIATWALGGFYQAYGPSIAVSQLGTHSTLMAAIVFSSYLLPCALGGPLTAGFSPANAQRYGMVVYTLAVIGILISIKFPLIESFLITTSYAGAAIPSFIAGQLSHFMNLFQIAVCYGLLAVVACIITLMFARNPKHVEIKID